MDQKPLPKHAQIAVADFVPRAFGAEFDDVRIARQVLSYLEDPTDLGGRVRAGDDT